MFWAALAALTSHFHAKRRWEGWLGAFQRATRVFAAFFLILFVVVAAQTFYDYYVRAPRDRAQQERIERCLQAHQVPVPVTYPGGPLTHAAEGAKVRCENEAR